MNEDALLGALMKGQVVVFRDCISANVSHLYCRTVYLHAKPALSYRFNIQICL